MGAPDLACESTRFLEVDVLCCDFDAVLRELVQREEVEGGRSNDNLCSRRAQSIGLVHAYEVDR